MAAGVLSGHRMLSPLGQLLWPIGALVLWLAVGSMSWPRHGDMLPNVLAYLLLAGAVSVGAVAAADDRAAATRAIATGITFLDVLGLLLVASSFAPFGYRFHSWYMHPRAVALVALVPVCWHLARWSGGDRWAGLRASIWIAAIIATLSRMATAAALLAVVLTILLHLALLEPPRRRRIWLLVGVIAAALLAVATVEPFRERLLKQDRTPIWQRVVSSALEAPVLGAGPGSSQAGPVLRYLWVSPPARPRPQMQRSSDWEYWAPHPHNEYLRVWHDLGAIGLGFLLLAFRSWVRVLFRGMRRSGRAHAPGEMVLEHAGLLMLIILMVTMLTDNPLVYPFVIAPAGVLIGAGVGASGAKTFRG